MMSACGWDWKHAEADNLELLCPIVAYPWDRTNLAIEVG